MRKCNAGYEMHNFDLLKWRMRLDEIQREGKFQRVVAPLYIMQAKPSRLSVQNACSKGQRQKVCCKQASQNTQHTNPPPVCDYSPKDTKRHVVVQIHAWKNRKRHK
ncbi:hypothetical protein LguiA_011129 [Lonicera macranthoides]